ncbi:TIGR02996 domain-containing protein [Gemmata sp. JC673]|uniref:TIGR02996 domain-containing protein n=1 Tax=Gemmata algarum TaxID=2975278 RepID=A0ABU5EX11_9BACT|nr:TIGR02996 domain-containing protein [Gemmata algarum]MDY3558251.1 TIGR02996 domain-containing protein [Gemmata algarum]
MTVEEAALLRAIAAVPGEVTARLAYADWLDEHDRGIEAAWVRHEGTAPPRVNVLAGGGHGEGEGNGSGHCFGNGYWRRQGNGYVSGYGSGHNNTGSGGRGRGYGCGEGYSDFNNGSGSGCSYGCGEGNGRGYGNCFGYGDKPTGPFKSHITHEEFPMPSPGAYVIVRSRDQGCVCGEYRGHHGREVVLGKARQIYSWEGGRLTLFDFAVVPGPCRVSREAPGEVVMLEACGIIPTTAEVEAFLRAHPGE